MDFTFRYDLDAPAGTYQLDTECPPYFTGPDKLIGGLVTASAYDGPAAARVAVNGLIEQAEARYRAASQRIAPQDQIDAFQRHAKAAKVATGFLSQVEPSSLQPAARGVPWTLDEVASDAEALSAAMDAHAEILSAYAEVINLSRKLHMHLVALEKKGAFVRKRQVKKPTGGDLDLIIRCLLAEGVWQKFPFWSYPRCPLVKAVAALLADAGAAHGEDMHQKVWEALRNNFLRKGIKIGHFFPV